MFKRLIPIGALLLLASSAGAQVINCPSGFSSSGACGVGIIAGGKAFEVNGTTNGSSPALSGSNVLLLSTGATHAALSLIYQTQVNVQAFNTSFTFVPNGMNVVFMINNSNNNSTFNGNVFSAGAGCEADFFQAFSQPNPPNNVFALELDSYSPATVGGSFTYSTAQIYDSPGVPGQLYVQSGCSPAINGETIYNKFSTSPVALNSPAGTLNTTTGDTYSANLVYDGTKLTLSLKDVTAGGSCPGATCFSHVWTTDPAGNTPINIPVWVGGNTAWVGFGGATGIASSFPLTINSMVYTVTSPGPSPTPTVTPTATCTP